MISFVAMILFMSDPDSIGSFRTVSVQLVVRDTACQSSMYSGREREHSNWKQQNVSDKKVNERVCPNLII